MFEAESLPDDVKKLDPHFDAKARAFTARAAARRAALRPRNPDNPPPLDHVLLTIQDLHDEAAAFRELLVAPKLQPAHIRQLLITAARIENGIREALVQIQKERQLERFRRSLRKRKGFAT